MEKTRVVEKTKQAAPKNLDPNKQVFPEGQPQILKSYFVPGLPHILLCPEKKPEWTKVNQAFGKIREELKELKPDILLIYSTYWPSVVSHQIQARPLIKWTLVDEEWHDLGSVPYEIKIDSDFSHAYKDSAEKRGLEVRTVDYDGFPVDTGSVVLQKLVNPDNQFLSSIVSSHVYADRAETVVLGKAARDALVQTQKTAAVFVVSSFSNRYLPNWPEEYKEEKFSSLKDEEWNQKFIELLSEGRLEDVSQLSRSFHSQARVSKKVVNFKPFWWLSSVMGSTNQFKGEILEYQPVHGTGAAVIGLTPSAQTQGDLEFDEEDIEVYQGNRNILAEDPS